MLTYDQDITFDSSELSGFFFCCDPSCATTNDTNKWPAVEPEYVKQVDSKVITIKKEGTGECDTPYLAYLWRETPIETGVWGAPIYSNDVFRIPSPPWLWAVHSPDPNHHHNNSLYYTLLHTRVICIICILLLGSRFIS